MNKAEKKFIQRQFNRYRVPNPLLEGLVFAYFGGTFEQQTKACKYIEEQVRENERAKQADNN